MKIRKSETFFGLRWMPLVAGAGLLVIVLVTLETRPGPSPLADSTSVSSTAGIQGSLQRFQTSEELALPVPLPVALSTELHSWAEGDASSPEVIEKIAHNPDEFIRMVEENDRIKRRQLVYRKETADESIQRAAAVGSLPRRIILPAFDGREIQFEITESKIDRAGQSGSFTGVIPGSPDSLVTLAFKNGREAFTVSCPAEGMYLEAEPREPGQIIVKEIDPATYSPGRCGTPEYTAGQSESPSK